MSLMQNPWIKLTRLDKPIGILLVLWPTYWALWVANEGFPDWKLWLIFTLGAVIMRSAGCIINDYADRHWDGKVKRTCSRPLVTGAIKPDQALKAFVSLLTLAAMLLLFLPLITWWFALLAAILATLYPFTKRWLHWPQAFLGLAFATAIPMAYSASLNTWPPADAWLMFIAVALWALIYDTAYAMVDRQDDEKTGIKSTAVWWGDDAPNIILWLQLLFIGLLLLLGHLLKFSWHYDVAMTAVAILFIQQQFWLRSDNLILYFKAFLHNQWVGMAVFVALVLGSTGSSVG